MAKKYDWESIEADFSAGIKSVVSIAKDHGLTEGGIRKRAKRDGWQRDLTNSVRSAAQSKLVRSGGTSSDQSLVRTDADIIEQASDEVTHVVLGHRKSLNLWKGIANKLAITLSEMGVDESNHGEFARSLNSGVDALGKCIKLERQAYSMDDESSPDTPERSLTDVELEARIADLSKKAGSG